MSAAENFCLRRRTTLQAQKYAIEPGERHDDGMIQQLDISPSKEREQPNQLIAVTATIQSERNEGNVDIESVRLDVADKSTVKENKASNFLLIFYVTRPAYNIC